jgi:hypothetical protein
MFSSKPIPRAKVKGVLLIDVPRVAQAKSMSCWHASAYMLWKYSQMKTGRQGPMNTLLETYRDNTGVTPPDFIRLAKKVGLMAVDGKGDGGTYTAESLESLLRSSGPVWCAGYWYGPGHVMVLTGIVSVALGATVYFNDPDRGVQKTGTLSWFNEKVASAYSDCLMVKNPAAY